ncbi:bifunctional diaminohydroxyphosphoribosylaminopyrimidine deaminase/5-amino-6-(5-phosphoribosylamino)uracil reductase RibD [Streptomyces sp. NPDC059578]|uniref:bifunctional diaminohydroxyphosphoribosylaminopyrimidine deaminase/5-amino-6-(5-phosphoribosylamino)uracil reductase RibD n=1 Tax=Streptomyces sp. NPDC059578 TaxID=3346874 RepID=UPI0036964075
MATAAEAAAMRRAVALAAHGLGHTSPNPVVGCVLIDARGEPVGEGHHQRAGGPHAEVHALRAAGERARGATAVVTLEPCDHTGRTGPCSRALLAAGVTRVVYAVADPTPDATGGADTLRAAGVDVERGLLAAEAETVNAAWLTSVRRGRPHVTWKYAATLDGRTAAADGTSRWISSPQARADVHRLRAESDAVVGRRGGTGAPRARPAPPGGRPAPPPGAGGRAPPGPPHPHLAVRGIEGARQPLRVVLDTSGTAVRPGARVLDAAAPTLIAVAEDVTATPFSSEGAAQPAVVRLPRAEGGLSVPALLADLHARGVRSVLLEGGARLAGAFVAAGAVDRVIGYLAPVLLGGGPAVLNGAGITTLAEALRLDMNETVPVGADLRITATPAPPAPSGPATAAVPPAHTKEH